MGGVSRSDFRRLVDVGDGHGYGKPADAVALTLAVIRLNDYLVLVFRSGVTGVFEVGPDSEREDAGAAVDREVAGVRAADTPGDGLQADAVCVVVVRGCVRADDVVRIGQVGVFNVELDLHEARARVPADHRRFVDVIDCHGDIDSVAHLRAVVVAYPQRHVVGVVLGVARRGGSTGRRLVVGGIPEPEFAIPVGVPRDDEIARVVAFPRPRQVGCSIHVGSFVGLDDH